METAYKLQEEEAEDSPAWNPEDWLAYNSDGSLKDDKLLHILDGIGKEYVGLVKRIDALKSYVESEKFEVKDVYAAKGLLEKLKNNSGLKKFYTSGVLNEADVEVLFNGLEGKINGSNVVELSSYLEEKNKKEYTAPEVLRSYPSEKEKPVDVKPEINEILIPVVESIPPMLALPYHEKEKLCYVKPEVKTYLYNSNNGEGSFTRVIPTGEVINLSYEPREREEEVQRVIRSETLSQSVSEDSSFLSNEGVYPVHSSFLRGKIESKLSNRSFFGNIFHRGKNFFRSLIPEKVDRDIVGIDYFVVGNDYGLVPEKKLWSFTDGVSLDNRDILVKTAGVLDSLDRLDGAFIGNKKREFLSGHSQFFREVRRNSNDEVLNGYLDKTAEKLERNFRHKEKVPISSLLPKFSEFATRLWSLFV